MELESRHYAPYLPFGLKIRCFRKGQSLFLEDLILTGEILDYILSKDANRFNYYRPMLKPLSDLVKEIEEGVSYMGMLNKIKENCSYEDTENIEYLCEFKGDLLNTSIEFWIINKLVEWHFDIRGLIPQKLAIDLDTIR